MLIVLLAAAFIYFIYLRPRVRLPKGTTATLIALRVALLTILVTLLLRPVAGGGGSLQGKAAGAAGIFVHWRITVR